MAFVGNAFTGTCLRSTQQFPSRANATNGRPPVCSAVNDDSHVTRRAVLGALLSAVGAVTAVSIAPAPALADRTLMAANRSFERYYPRISAGGTTLREIGTELAKGNASAATSAAEARDFSVKFRRALGIYATSFSDNYVGQKTRDLQACADRLFDEVAAMKAATESEEAIEHYSMAVEAYRRYIKIARLPKETAEGFDNARAVVMK